jgi:hypothetical protein
VEDALDRLEADLATGADPERLAGRSVESSALQAQLTRRYTAYHPTPAPA